MSAPREIENGRDRGHGVNVRARRSARSNSDEGQRATTATKGGWVSATEKNLRVRYVVSTFNFQTLNMFYCFKVIIESTVMVNLRFFLFFLQCWRVGRIGTALALCRRCVGAVSEKREKKKKKKKGHRRTSETGASSLFRCPTCVGRGHDAKNGVSVQPSHLFT